MPKLFGSAVSGLAVVVLATGLLGCRTTTTQLASVPGLGWLDRGDEGWANYEPAPGLPKPSTTNEPTSGGPAANIATNDKADSPFSDPVSKLAKGDSKSRFDTDRYLPKKGTGSSTQEKAATFGNYASAYGKFAPQPKAGATPDTTKSLATQDGPYSVDGKAIPKFASTGASKDFTTDSKAPSFGPALDDLGSKKPEYTASTTSRFGTPAFDKPKSTATASTYTPPGFPATPKTDAVENRFGAAADTVNSTLDQAKQFTPVANSFNNGQQTFNRFSNDVAATANNTLGQATNAASNATQSVANAGSQAIDRFANQTSQVTNPFNNAASTASNQLNKAASGSQPLTNSFAGQSQNALVDSAQNTVNSAQSTFNNAVSNTVSSAVAGARDYASGYQNAAAGAVHDVKNRFGNVAPAQTPSFSTTVQNATQNISQGVTNQVQNYAQGAVTAAEQGVASRYGQAKSAATNYANSTINNATQRANDMVNSATNGASQQPVVEAAQNLVNTATNGLNQAATTVQGYANAGQNAVNNVMQNVSNSGQTPAQYPSTNTPNPFMNPPRVLSSPAPTVTPPPGAPSFNNVPSYTPGQNTPPPSIQRDASPFLPGSTKSFQGTTTVRKQEIELAGAVSTEREPLMLAVGDQYQFPRSLR